MMAPLEPKRNMGPDEAAASLRRVGGIRVIRQAISCDICGTEKGQTNHWFVAYEHGGEFRASGWSSRSRLRPGTKHLCGQTCLHKLVDEFMAKAIAQKPQTAAANAADVEERAARTDTSLTRDAAYDAVESSARLITPAAPALPMPIAKRPTELVAMAGRLRNDAMIPAPDEPRYASRNRHAEAWEREREREMRSLDCRTDLQRRRANAR